MDARWWGFKGHAPCCAVELPIGVCSRRTSLMRSMIGRYCLRDSSVNLTGIGGEQVQCGAREMQVNTRGEKVTVTLKRRPIQSLVRAWQRFLSAPPVALQMAHCLPTEPRPSTS